MAVVRSEKFIMVESGNNHNKCWYIEEHDNGLIRTTWGRVGNALSTTDKLFGINSSKEYDKLVKSKLKKGYTKLRTIDSASSSSVNNIQKKNLEDIALKEIVFDKADNQIKSMIQVFVKQIFIQSHLRQISHSILQLVFFRLLVVLLLLMQLMMLVTFLTKFMTWLKIVILVMILFVILNNIA